MAATESYRKDSDPVGTFLADATIVSGYERDFMTARELNEAFKLLDRGARRDQMGPTDCFNANEGQSGYLAPSGDWEDVQPWKVRRDGLPGHQAGREFAARKRADESADSHSGWGPR